MTIQAKILLHKNEFIAELSDGQRFVQGDLRALAGELHQAGVLAGDALCEWRTGHRMLTAGQQVALNAEMRRLEKLKTQPRTETPVRNIALAA
jgi:hypothetical protein